MLTFLAALDMSPEFGSSANLDRLHHAPLNPIDVAGVGTAPRFAVTTKDVRYFQSRPEHVSHPLSSPPPRWTPLAPPALADLRAGASRHQAAEPAAAEAPRRGPAAPAT